MVAKPVFYLVCSNILTKKISLLYRKTNSKFSHVMLAMVLVLRTLENCL